MAPAVFLVAFLLAETNRQPSYAEDIAPIIRAKCAVCHYDGGPAPFALTSFDSVHRRGSQIAAVTRSRYMPPWLPEPQPHGFEDESRLKPLEIQAIAEWVRAGMPEGQRRKAPPIPVKTDGWRLGPPDLILQPATALEVPAGGNDVFWNFILTPQITQGKFVRAVDIHPANPKIVHHANLIIDRTGSQREREQTPGAGFAGMDVAALGSPLDLPGHFLFWKPGSAPWTEPDGLAWRLEPGNDLILNLHLQPSGKPETDRPDVALYFTDKPATRFPYLLQLEHDGALDIPAGARDFTVSDSLRLPVDTQIVAIYPHAHYLGTLLEAWAVPPDGKRVQLIRIPAWNPNWQAVYRYRQPVRLPAGTMVHMRYHYDNSSANPRNPNHPPKRVAGGNQSTDEMGHLWLEVLPEQPGDARRLFAEAWARHQTEKYPLDFEAEVALGGIELARARAPEALLPLAEAVRRRPDDAVARNLYGSALAVTGRTQEAIVQYRLAIERRPDFPNARFNLAHALARSGDTAGAIAQIRAILSVHPGDPAALDYLDQLAPKH